MSARGRAVTSGATRLVFVRHGLAAVAPGVFPPPGTPLTPAGRAEVGALGVSLARGGLRPAALWSSDLPRAAETAAILGAALGGVATRLDRRLREADPGAWAGFTAAEVEATRPAEAATWLADLAGYAPPGGESLAQAATRVREALDDLLALARRAAGPCLVVGHSGTARILIADALGLPLDRAIAIDVEAASLTTLDRYEDGAWSLRRLNWRPSLF